MNDKPTPPDGYEVMLGRDLPSPVPDGTQFFADNEWSPSNYCGSAALVGTLDQRAWYAIPVQKAADHCIKCGGPCEMFTGNGCKGDSGPSGPPTALDTQVGGDHYKTMAIQPIEFCVRNGIGFAEGLAIKYIVRHGQKNGAEDLDKAIHCLQILRELKYGKPV